MRIDLITQERLFHSALSAELFLLSPSCSRFIREDLRLRPAFPAPGLPEPSAPLETRCVKRGCDLLGSSVIPSVFPFPSKSILPVAPATGPPS